jgi:predicted GNAT family acetyltransferase
MTANSPTVSNNASSQRYELNDEGSVVGIAQYRMDGDALVFTHTEIQPQHEGRGYGSALARGALEDVRRQGLQVVALCEFIASYIDRNPEYRELLAEG